MKNQYDYMIKAMQDHIQKLRKSGGESDLSHVSDLEKEISRLKKLKKKWYGESKARKIINLIEGKPSKNDIESTLLAVRKYSSSQGQIKSIKTQQRLHDKMVSKLQKFSDKYNMDYLQLSQYFMDKAKSMPVLGLSPGKDY
jgi:hypothetical protein